MRSAGLITNKTSLAFHGWTVDTGPLVESNAAIWDEITAALAKGKVETAAQGLRHHLEYVSRHLADQLGARPVFKSDGNYELGELLPSVLARMRELCGKAVEAAQSWGDTAARDAALERKKALSTSNGAISVEQWAVNRAVHYNEWANFGRKDFQPVVTAFRELLGCFQCHSFIGRALTAAGDATEFAASGAEAMRSCACARYDLVILDLVITDMDGREVLGGLLSARPDQAVIVLSCVADVAAKVDLLERGAQDYLTKPFSLAELLARVRVQLPSEGTPRRAASPRQQYATGNQ